MTQQLSKTSTERSLTRNSRGHQAGLSIPSFKKEEFTLDSQRSEPLPAVYPRSRKSRRSTILDETHGASTEPGSEERSAGPFNPFPDWELSEDDLGERPLGLNHKGQFGTAQLEDPNLTQVRSQLQQKTKEFDLFSLALDESTDVQDTAQLLIFIRGVSANFEICEELAALQSLKGTTTGEDIFDKVCQTMEKLDLDWSKLASITTDGAPSMVGETRGLIGRMNRELEKRGLTAPLRVHCLIHQQALCCKVLTWDSVMKVVVSCINFIRAKGLKHRQFQEFLSELESTHGDVLYYTEVRWLSRGRVLRRFYELLPEINAFLHLKDKTVPELIDPEWKWHLAFFNRRDRNT
ncbi:hypothetical protein J4Q44_G00169060 [Coregonus suidteri]|uniref:General transcription factor II-I repeat domain-containing protein 2-like n=1 Tax=Coregonus suidteri TaxID=861788 RepID=A0AAN8LNU8_9TELE